jgi:hypothetical protein
MRRIGGRPGRWPCRDQWQPATTRSARPDGATKAAVGDGPPMPCGRRSHRLLAGRQKIIRRRGSHYSVEVAFAPVANAMFGPPMIAK